MLAGLLAQELAHGHMRALGADELFGLCQGGLDEGNGVLYDLSTCMITSATKGTKILGRAVLMTPLLHR